MKILFLPGMKCRPWIWDGAIKNFHVIEMEVVDYPHEITSKAILSNDIANWVESNYLSGNQYDVIVGHSMGGVLALHLVNNHKNLILKVILVETFLLPSLDFYHNLLFGNEQSSIRGQIEAMLKNEGLFYTSALMHELRTADYTNLALPILDKLSLLYGGRGCEDRQTSLEALNLPKLMIDSIKIEYIDNACHFPMLENEDVFYSVLNQIMT